MSEFEASVQYNDLKGTVAADQGDQLRIGTFLKEQRIIGDTDHVIGWRFGFHNNHGEVEELPSVVVYFTSEQVGEDRSLKNVKAVCVDISFKEFTKFLKRLDIVAINKDLDLSNTVVDGPHYD